jgi:hypothetical protein
MVPRLVPLFLLVSIAIRRCISDAQAFIKLSGFFVSAFFSFGLAGQEAFERCSS